MYRLSLLQSKIIIISTFLFMILAVAWFITDCSSEAAHEKTARRPQTESSHGRRKTG